MKRRLLVAGYVVANLLFWAFSISSLFAGVGTKPRQNPYQTYPPQTPRQVQFDQPAQLAANAVQIQQQSVPVPQQQTQQQMSPKPRPRQTQGTQQAHPHRQQWTRGNGR